MKTYYVKDLEKNLILPNETFALIEVEKAEDKNGKVYYKLLLGDKTGRIPAKIWGDRVSKIEIKALKIGKIVSVSAKVEEYQGKPQLNILELAGVDEAALDAFVETSEYDPEEMMDELLKEIDQISHSGIRKVLKNIFTDKEFLIRFKYGTAAKSIHHDFRSGLLQHILEMISISKGLKRFYPKVDFDLLTAGIILHDIGKVEELDSSGVATSYTKKGTLIGHIVMGVMIFEKYGGKDLPEDCYLHICHLILSHHGSLEYGSPIVPATVEAVMLTYIDDLSSKARTATKAINEIPDGKDFSNYNMWLENARLWKGGNYTEDKPLVDQLESKLKKDEIINNMDNENEDNIMEPPVQLSLD